MVRIQIINPNLAEYGEVLEARIRPTGQWETDLWIFSNDEVRVLGKHEGEYDPNHWGEQDPDAYDRMGFNGDLAWMNLQGYPPHGRHLLDTGVN
jgi:hypothetical protein